MIMNNSLFKQKIKALFYFLLFYSGILHLCLMVFKKVKKEHSAAILVYHRVVDDNTNEFLYKGAAIHHHIKDFKREILFISKWFKIISMDDLISNIKNKKNFSAPSIAITFDDGYRDNYTLAYPVLRQFGLAATIYLVTGLLGTYKRTWLDEIEYALLNTNANCLTFPRLFEDEVLNISSLEEKLNANKKIGEALKRIDNKKKWELICELYNRLGVNRDSITNQNRRMLNWEEIKEMSENNISFGAHTHSHPILTQMSIEEAKQEITTSKKIIENELHISTDHFAFPNGTSIDFNEELRQFCIDIGFKSVTTVEYGTNDMKSDPYSLKRDPPYTPLHMFATEIVRLFWKKY